MKRLGIEAVGVHMVHLFAHRAPEEKTILPALRAARQIGIPIRLVPNSPEMLEIVRHPRFGYGKNVNPCIDCRILTLGMSRAIMDDEGARFVVTGEVLGQRPMSQRRDPMRSVEREAGLEGLVLRPLSAKLLEPTLPEREGWVDREQLYDISGRSRTRQMALAKEFGITEYPSPAGGCLLTDPGFAARLRDLASHGGFTLWDIHMAKLGRHLRLDERAKLILGRKHIENAKIRTFARPGDLLLELDDIPGPTGALQGENARRLIPGAAAILARYSKARDLPEVAVRWHEKGGQDEGRVAVAPAPAESATRLLVDR